MSPHTITRIANVLKKQFEGLIDVSDVSDRVDQAEQLFLSRALAALCIKNLAGQDPASAANSVTDGFHDNGLDAVCFDARSDTLFLVQTKWSDTGNKPLDADGSGAFVSGVRDLLSARFDRFNPKVRAKEGEVRTALWSERPIRIRLIVAHTSTQPTPAHAIRKIEDLIADLNAAVPVAKADYFDQAGVYDLITSESKPPKIKVQIGLNDWGIIDKPFLAYYGRVHVGEVAQWWNEHGNALFSQNLRLFYHSSSVNDALQNTLAKDPESFWYFNNGITIICDSVAKNLAGSPGRVIGLFTCEGVSIVNGAQTVGTIGRAALDRDPLKKDPEPPQSWVQVRIISLEYCPPDFGRLITRAANLQNAVGNREFAAMHPLQHRLATDFALDRRKYVYRSGEPAPRGEEGCDIVEATQALGCAHSVSLAVQVKREIGAVWADTESPLTPISSMKN
jgi:AIPR protein